MRNSAVGVLTEMPSDRRLIDIADCGFVTAGGVPDFWQAVIASSVVTVSRNNHSAAERGICEEKLR